MFTDLPQIIQQQILQFLETNNFLAAKELRDSWLKTNNKPHKLDDLAA